VVIRWISSTHFWIAAFWGFIVSLEGVRPDIRFPRDRRGI